MLFHLQWSWSREYSENTLRSTSHFSFAVTQPRLVPRRDSLLWSLQIHIDMSHAILHSLISQHCAHWTHCCTHTHYRSEQETTYAVPETTTRQKSLVKDHLHSFLVASPSREALIYQEICAVVFSRHGASLHLSGDGRGEGFTLLLLFLFGSLTSQLSLSHRVWETSLCCLFSPVLAPLLEEEEGGRRDGGAHVATPSTKPLQQTEMQLCLRQCQSCCVLRAKAVPAQCSTPTVGWGLGVRTLG